MDEESVRHNVIMILIDVLMSGEQPITVKELVSKMGHNNDYGHISKGLRRITGRGVDGFPGILVILWQYPSIFTVKNSRVWITTFSQLSDINCNELLYESDMSSNNDNIAIDFYEFQLKRFGAYFVPITRLFDTRAQSSKYIKLITGKSIEQFTQFLKSYENVFTVSEEYVVLTENLRRASINGNTITRIDAPIVLDEKVYESTRIIVNTFHAKQIIDTIFETASVVTVDLEGVNLGSVNGSITLIQLAFLPKQAMNGCHSGVKAFPKIFIFDIWSNSNLVTLCLKHLLESDKIKKVFHGCEDDSYALYRDFGVILKNFIDTQAVHTVITSNLIDDSCDNKTNNGQSEAIGLNGLFELYGGYGSNPLKSVVKKRYVGNSHYWCSRPLTQEMIYYAAYDVYVLLGIYMKLCAFMSQIKGKSEILLNELNMRAAFGRIWAEEDRQSTDPRNYRRKQPYSYRRQTNNNRQRYYR